MRRFLLLVGLVLAYRAISFGLSGFFDGDPTADVFEAVGLPPSAEPVTDVQQFDGSERLERTKQSFRAPPSIDVNAFYQDACTTLGWTDAYVSPPKLSCGRRSWERWRGLSVKPCEPSEACTHTLTVWATRPSRW